MKQTTTKPFDVYLPGSANQKPRFIETIHVEVETSSGEEFLTQGSRQRIERIRARHMGLISGEEIRAMRKRLGLSQKELTALLDCGEKSLSRWENGHGFPTGIINKMLRLLDEGFLSPDALKAVQGPRSPNEWARQFNFVKDRAKTIHYGAQGHVQIEDPSPNLIPFELPASA
ncbi:MAG: type II toxin-antitoxin system MqsA family antitoxin [Opitutales bacterium]|nr:type II toxin-antitoxin system MqsA family antitoxin [Opitutales bacterium]MCH8539804.1 type II toxin-antitoxin system MqsA family antitoxin [Opitutales bacterium]